MKSRWMLFDKRNDKLVSWTAFPTKEAADKYRMIGTDIWLKPPYYVNEEATKFGGQRVKRALVALNWWEARKVKIEIAR